MGGTTPQPTVQWSSHWYVREIVITRSENGFLHSIFTLQVAFGERLTDSIDPVTGNELFEVWDVKLISFTGSQLLDWLTNSSMSEADKNALLTSLLTTDSQIAATSDDLLNVLKNLGKFDDSAIPKVV